MSPLRQLDWQVTRQPTAELHAEPYQPEGTLATPSPSNRIQLRTSTKVPFLLTMCITALGYRKVEHDQSYAFSPLKTLEYLPQSVTAAAARGMLLRLQALKSDGKRPFVGFTHLQNFPRRR